MPLDQLLALWEARAEDFRRWNALVDGAGLCEQMCAELRDARRMDETSGVSLAEAARLSGYSRDHLARLVRQGKIPNAGRRGAPRIRRADLPRRPARSLAGTSAAGYDALADARKLVSRRRGGEDAS